MPETFKAILISRDADKKQSVAVTELTDAELMDGDVTVAVECDHGQLQGWAGDHRQGAGGAPLSAGAGHRFRGNGAVVLASGLEGGRQGHAQRLGCRRDAFRRLCRPRPRQGRLAGAAARRVSAQRDAMAIGTAGYTAMLCGDGAGAPRRSAGSRARGRHRRGRRRRLGGDRAAVAGSATTSSPRPGGRQKAAICSDLGAAEIISRDELSAPGQAARQGALGGRRRCGRQPHARQCPVDDVLWRRGRRLRPGRRHGPAGQAWRRSSCAASRCSASIR